MIGSRDTVSIGDIAAGAVALLAGVQLITKADPIGRSLLLVKQLVGHVSSPKADILLGASWS